jgi:hypothetical protein
MFHVRFHWFSAAGLLLTVWMPTAQAQPPFYREISVEALVLNADAVVVGTVVEVSKGDKFNEATNTV